jgi:hypothetical protein
MPKPKPSKRPPVLKYVSLIEVMRHVDLLANAQKIVAAELAELRAQSDRRILADETVVARLEKLPTVIALSEHLSVTAAACRRLTGEKEQLHKALMRVSSELRDAQGILRREGILK